MGQAIRRSRRRLLYKKKVLLSIIAIIMAVLIAATVIIVVLVRNAKQPDGSDTPPVQTAPTAMRVLPTAFIDRNTASPYVILADLTNNQVLYEKNATTKCYPASLTKLLTALVAMDHTTADTQITVGSEINLIDSQSSRANLRVNHKMTMKQLLYALLLPSGNDAAYTIAVQVGRLIAGDESLDKYAALNVFCEEMNAKAAALGCTGSHFQNPDGIHEADHYTTAADMLKIATAAMQNELIAEVVATPQITVTILSGQTLTWTNTNRLLREGTARYYAGATGLKTGSTDEAGCCLAASATRDGKAYIAIVMGAKTDAERWDDAGGLLDLSFQ